MARAAPFVLVAGVIGLLAGAAAFYWTGGLSGNAASADCAPARQVAGRMAPLARGEVAAFRVTERPAPVPALAFKAPDGRDLTLADFRGKVVLLNLWATWCVPCRREMPALDQLQKALGGDHFQVVAVNIDTRNPDRPKQFLSEAKIDGLAYYTDATARIFQDLKAAGKAFGMPTSLLIDPNGCELGVLAGPAEWASPDGLALVKAAIGP